MKKYHVLLIAAMATLGLSACDNGDSPADNSAPAEDASMMESGEEASEEAMEIIEEADDEASESMDEIMEEISTSAEKDLSESMEKMMDN